MEVEIRQEDEFIKLGQALKKAGLDAKMIIQDGRVTVNGEIEERRGRKLYPGDVVSLEGDSFKVVK